MKKIHLKGKPFHATQIFSTVGQTLSSNMPWTTLVWDFIADWPPVYISKHKFTAMKLLSADWHTNEWNEFRDSQSCDRPRNVYVRFDEPRQEEKQVSPISFKILSHHITMNKLCIERGNTRNSAIRPSVVLYVVEVQKFNLSLLSFFFVNAGQYTAAMMLDGWTSTDKQQRKCNGRQRKSERKTTKNVWGWGGARLQHKQLKGSEGTQCAEVSAFFMITSLQPPP